MSQVQGVIFDAFGTVLQIKNARHPFRQLLKLGIGQGRRPKPDDATVLMTNPFSLEQAADHFEIVARPSDLAKIQAELDAEVAAIEPFPDAVTCIKILRSHGLKVAICSNLALPYGAAVDRIFPDLDAYGYSFAVGELKPDPRIYESVLTQLGIQSGEAWMVGDSQRCDRDGAIKQGIKGHFLNRTGLAAPDDFMNLRSFADVVLQERFG